MKKLSYLLVLFAMLYSCDLTPETAGPVACFTLTSENVMVNETVNFTNCSEEASSFGWDFGDGKVSTTENPTHKYTEPGQYEVRLKAYRQSLSDEISKTIIVSDESVESPNACFTVNTSSLATGESFQFSNCSENATSYEWDFGDGNASTETNPSHSYNNAGTYTVQLTASSSSGSDITSKSVTVTDNSTITVTFNVNMNIQTAYGNFIPGVDKVDIAGTFNDWGNNLTNMDDPDDDGIYTVTIGGFTVDQAIEYKFRMNGDWENAEYADGSNRIYTVKASGNILSHFYNDEEIVTVDPYDYFGIPWPTLSDYFIDEFDNNDNQWLIAEDTAYITEIINGHYNIQNFTPENWWFFWSGTTAPDATKSWEIEFNARITNYTENYASGLVWGLNNNPWGYYSTEFGAEGNYQIGYFNGSEYIQYIGFSPGGNGMPNYNKFTVRKLGNSYYFFLNEGFVHEEAFGAFFGDKFGFVAGPTVKMEIDFIRIRYINLNFTKSMIDIPKIEPLKDIKGSAGALSLSGY